MPSLPRRALAAALMLCAGDAAAAPLYVTVTAYRSVVGADVAGTDITVIDRAAIERSRADSVAGVLRQVPGVSLYESGGPGSQALAMLRGANAQHTLVLVDGVRVNDPTSTSAQFDFSSIALTDVERIEVLKGPQTALYGSDALGGVIQIFTRRGAGKPSASATVEGGSYGTARGSAAVSGAKGPFSLSASGTWFQTDGFSRVGNRDAGEKDGTEKMSGTLSGAYDAGNGVKIDASVTGNRLHSEVDGSSTLDAPGYLWDRDLLSGYGRLTLAPPGSRLHQTLTFSAMDEVARFTEPTRVTDYTGRTLAAEYQGELRLRQTDSLLFGGRIEEQRTSLVSPTTTVTSEADLLAAFAIYRLDLGKRWHFSFGGRHDQEIGGEGFTTGRFTAAYDVRETGTKLRGSVANGANRPTAYQLYHPVFGTPGLLPEKSIGADLGIDQSLFDGRMTFSVTGFYNRFSDLIAFDSATSRYKNIAAAETGGIELAVTATLVPGVLHATGGYTWLLTRNLSSDPALYGNPLQRRPEHSGTVSITFTGIERLELTATAYLAGERFNDDKAKVRLAPYARVDLYAAYRIDAHFTAFGRVENLFDADYHEIAGYNTPGLSAYAGLTWKH